MKLYGETNQEKATGQLIHDHANIIDRMTFQLSKLDKWNKENVKTKLVKGEACDSTTFVIAEYLRSDIKRMKAAIDSFYNEFSNDFK